jgi:hypothetical protein
MDISYRRAGHTRGDAGGGEILQSSIADIAKRLDPHLLGRNMARHVLHLQHPLRRSEHNPSRIGPETDWQIINHIHEIFIEFEAELAKPRPNRRRAIYRPIIFRKSLQKHDITRRNRHKIFPFPRLRGRDFQQTFGLGDHKILAAIEGNAIGLRAAADDDGRKCRQNVGQTRIAYVKCRTRDGLWPQAKGNMPWCQRLKPHMHQFVMPPVQAGDGAKPGDQRNARQRRQRAGLVRRHVVGTLMHRQGSVHVRPLAATSPRPDHDDRNGAACLV